LRLHSALKCPVDSSLNKNSPTPAQEADFSSTLVSSCDHGQRFDDGLDVEEIKCSTAPTTGVWNHRQYSCHGKYSLSQENTHAYFYPYLRYIIIDRFLSFIHRNIATRYHVLIFKAKKHQIRFQLGCVPDPAGGAHSAPPDTLDIFKGSYFSGKGREGEGKEEGGGKGCVMAVGRWTPL